MHSTKYTVYPVFYIRAITRCIRFVKKCIGRKLNTLVSRLAPKVHNYYFLRMDLNNWGTKKDCTYEYSKDRNFRIYLLI